MDKILFVTDSYGWKATANGVCVSEIAEYYRDMHCDVHVLCFRRKGESTKELINGITIHRIRMNLMNHLRAVHEIYDCSSWKKKTALFIFKWLNRLQSMIFLYWFPMHTPIFIYRYCKKISNLHKQYTFDSVVASYCPFEAAGGTYLFKNRFPETFTCLYILDSLSNLIPRFFLSREWQDKKGWKWEQKFYEKYDLILNLQCHDKHYAQSRYDRFRSKMRSTDIPHISESKLPKYHTKNNHGTISFLYAGLFRKITGNYALKLLGLLAEEQTFELKIYTRSEIELARDDINESLHEMLQWKGFVPREEVLAEEEKADILISMEGLHDTAACAEERSAHGDKNLFHESDRLKG